MNGTQLIPTLEQFGIFCYKALVWLFLGVVIGAFVASMQGFLPILLIVVYLVGSIGLGLLFSRVFFRYTDRKRRALAQTSGLAAPARIDAIRFGGVRMLETRELMVIQVTVFQRSGAPYQTTVRQFMTVGEGDLLQEGSLVTFLEDPHDPGYGMVSTILPAGEIPADIRTFQADKVYPERRKTGLWLLVGRNPNGLARSVSFILILALFGAGFISPYTATGNVDWLRLRLRYFPQKLVFQDKGNFNPEMFKKAYDKAVAYIGDRRIESLLFYKDFTDIRVEPTDEPGRLQGATIRGNSVGTHFIHYSLDDEDRLFTLESVRYDALKKALDDAAKDHDIADIMYIGFRKDIRWSMPVAQRERYVDIHIVFEGGETSLDYHGETGERLPD